MKGLGYLGAALGGVLVGAAAAVLFAPEKGIDTRAKIKNAISDFCDKHDIKLTKKELEEFADDIE